MPKNERITRILHEHVASIRDAFGPQGETIIALAAHLTETFHRGGRIFVCGSGMLTIAADLTANLFLYRLAFERPALPAISLCHDAKLLHALNRDGLGRQVFARQLRACAAEDDLLLVYADSQPDPALNEVVIAAERIGMTTAVFSPSRNDFGSEEPPQFVFHLERTAPGRIVEAAVVFAHLLCELVEADLFEH